MAGKLFKIINMTVFRLILGRKLDSVSPIVNNTRLISDHNLVIFSQTSTSSHIVKTKGQHTLTV